MARSASPALMDRISLVYSMLGTLNRDLVAHGDAGAADAVKRARREIDLVVRQGLFQSRGENV